MKFISFELEKTGFSINFKYGVFRGVYDVQIFSGPVGNRLLPQSNFKLKSATPPLIERIALWIKFRAIRYLNNRQNLYNQ